MEKPRILTKKPRIPNLTSETLVLRNGLIKSDVGSSLILYDVKSETFYAFNETAADILNFMKYNLPLSEIKEKVQKYFDTKNVKEFDKDFDEFVHNLKKLDFLAKTDIVNKDYVQCNITHSSKYLKPIHKEYSKKWMKENHPATFNDVSFCDTWNSF